MGSSVVAVVAGSSGSCIVNRSFDGVGDAEGPGGGFGEHETLMEGKYRVTRCVSATAFGGVSRKRAVVCVAPVAGVLC